MKKMTWITGILAGVMVVLAALGSVCGVIANMAGDEQFYSSMSRAAVTTYLGVTDDPQADAKATEYIGLTDEEQEAFAGGMAAFMRGETEAQPQILNEKEMQHMRDVRAITAAAGSMSKAYLTIAAALSVVIAWTGARLKKRHMPKAIGSLAAVGLIELIVMNISNEISTGGFAYVFEQMHQVMFANDLWLMDPATDVLIRMMPQPLFEQALLLGISQALRMFFIVWLMLLAIDFIVGGMIRRQLSKEKQG